MQLLFVMAILISNHPSLLDPYVLDLSTLCTLCCFPRTERVTIDIQAAAAAEPRSIILEVALRTASSLPRLLGEFDEEAEELDKEAMTIKIDTTRSTHLFEEDISPVVSKRVARFVKLATTRRGMEESSVLLL